MPELHKELADQGANLLLKVIKGYPQTFENPLKQSEQDATYGMLFFLHPSPQEV